MQIAFDGWDMGKHFSRVDSSLGHHFSALIYLLQIGSSQSKTSELKVQITENLENYISKFI